MVSELENTIFEKTALDDVLDEIDVLLNIPKVYKQKELECKELINKIYEQNILEMTDNIIQQLKIEMFIIFMEITEERGN